MVEECDQAQRAAGRVSTQGAKPVKNQQLQQGALAVMRASTRGFSIMKGRQVEETRKLLVSGGFRSRDAIGASAAMHLLLGLVRDELTRIDKGQD